MIKQYCLIFVMVLTSILFVNCEKTSSNDEDPKPNNSNCDTIVVINEQDFNNANSDLITINSYEVEDDCLNINFSSGGCDGSSWKLTLVSSGKVLYSNPPQMHLRFNFENSELCEAYITKEKSFDLSVLEFGGGQVILHIENIDQSILYE